MAQSRWFVLTDIAFAYYKEEGGEIMGTVELDNVTNVLDIDQKSLRIVANKRFTVTGSREVHLRFESESVKRKYVAYFSLVIHSNLS